MPFGNGNAARDDPTHRAHSSAATPDRPGPRDVAPVRVAFHIRTCVGIRDDKSFALPWLACALPCRRFADILAEQTLACRLVVERLESRNSYNGQRIVYTGNVVRLRAFGS